MTDREILRARAKELAVEPGYEFEKKELLEIIAFSLGNENYGIEGKFVREVHSIRDFTPLPGVPPFILGIINVRGQIFSVVNLKKFFDLPEKGLGELNKVIIIRNDNMEFGLLADAIIGARSITVTDLQPVLPNVSSIGETFLLGVSPEHLIVLDGEKILSHRKMIIHNVVENTALELSDPALL